MLVGDWKKQLTQMNDVFVLRHEEERGSMIQVGFYTWWRREWQINRKQKPEIVAGFIQNGKGNRKREMMDSKIKLLFVIISDKFHSMLSLAFVHSFF